MSDVDHTPPDQQVPPARPTPPGESTIARPVAATAVEALPPTPASSGNDRDAAATDDARAAEPSTALVDPAPLSSLLRLYALVALTYAQRLASVEEQARAATDGQQVLSAALAGVRARLARLEERQDTRAGVDAQRLTAALDAFQDAQEDSAGRGTPGNAAAPSAVALTRCGAPGNAAAPSAARRTANASRKPLWPSTSPPLPPSSRPPPTKRRTWTLHPRRRRVTRRGGAPGPPLSRRPYPQTPTIAEARRQAARIGMVLRRYSAAYPGEERKFAR